MKLRKYQQFTFGDLNEDKLAALESLKKDAGKPTSSNSTTAIVEVHI